MSRYYRTALSYRTSSVEGELGLAFVIVELWLTYRLHRPNSAVDSLRLLIAAHVPHKSTSGLMIDSDAAIQVPLRPETVSSSSAQARIHPVPHIPIAPSHTLHNLVEHDRQIVRGWPTDSGRIQPEPTACNVMSRRTWLDIDRQVTSGIRKDECPLVEHSMT